MNANMNKYYIPNTRILLTEYFEKVIKVKNKIKRNGLGNYLLVKVKSENNGRSSQLLEKLYTQIAGATRAEDFVGILGDGNCYILLNQTDQANADKILNRLAQRGFPCELLPDNYQLPLEANVRIPEASASVSEIKANQSVKKTGPLFLNSTQVNIVEDGKITRWDQSSPSEIHPVASGADASTKPELIELQSDIGLEGE